MINKKLVRPRIMSDAFSRNMEEEDKGKWVPCEKCGEAFRKKDASLKVRNLCSKCKNV